MDTSVMWENLEDILEMWAQKLREERRVFTKALPSLLVLSTEAGHGKDTADTLLPDQTCTEGISGIFPTRPQGL